MSLRQFTSYFIFTSLQQLTDPPVWCQRISTTALGRIHTDPKVVGTSPVLVMAREGPKNRALFPSGVVQTAWVWGHRYICAQCPFTMSLAQCFFSSPELLIFTFSLFWCLTHPFPSYNPSPSSCNTWSEPPKLLIQELLWQFGLGWVWGLWSFGWKFCQFSCANSSPFVLDPWHTSDVQQL